MYNNVFYNAAGSAISGNSAPLYVFVNNIFYGNYQDVDNVNLPITSSATISRNAYGPHTVASVGWYPTPLIFALSANPFVNASSGNFQLNTTVGGGASLIGAGYPLLFGPSTINYLNIGAVQSQLRRWRCNCAQCWICILTPHFAATSWFTRSTVAAR